MKGKRKNTSDIDFGRDQVTVYLTDAEYKRIESVGRGGFNDGRAVKGMLRTFAAIRLYGLAAGTTGSSRYTATYSRRSPVPGTTPDTGTR